MHLDIRSHLISTEKKNVSILLMQTAVNFIQKRESSNFIHVYLEGTKVLSDVYFGLLLVVHKNTLLVTLEGLGVKLYSVSRGGAYELLKFHEYNSDLTYCSFL